jgi:hypothetical protein
MKGARRSLDLAGLPGTRRLRAIVWPGGVVGSDSMALLFRFELVTTMTADRYAQIVRRLEVLGAGAPPGRLYHVAYGSFDRLKVADVWESAQQFQEFGKLLLPTLEEVEIVLLEPDVSQVYNIIRPRRPSLEESARLLVMFDPPRMDAGQYNEIIKRLDEAGHGAPPERLYHVSHRVGDDLGIISVWQNEQALRAFFDRVVRIAGELGLGEIPRTALVIERVHHIIDGSDPFRR